MKCIYSNVIDGLLKYNCGCGKRTDRSSLELCREISTRDPVVALALRACTCGQGVRAKSTERACAGMEAPARARLEGGG